MCFVEWSSDNTVYDEETNARTHMCHGYESHPSAQGRMTGLIFFLLNPPSPSHFWFSLQPQIHPFVFLQKSIPHFQLELWSSSSPWQPPPPPPPSSPMSAWRGGLLPSSPPQWAMWFCLSPLQLEASVQPFHTQLMHFSERERARMHACLQNILTSTYIFPPSAILRTFFFFWSVISFLLGWSKSGVRAFVWHLFITSGQWCIQQSNLLPMLWAHMCFPLRQEAKEHIIQPVTIQPLPQQWVHSLRERTAFWAWTRWDAVKPDLLWREGGRGALSKRSLHHPCPPTQLNKPHECGENTHQSCRGCTRSVWNLCRLIIFDFYIHAGSWGPATTLTNSERRAMRVWGQETGIKCPSVKFHWLFIYLQTRWSYTFNRHTANVTFSSSEINK